jgi:NADPH-dependent glutamate synthase beta subunit-like oxidoreductase
MRPAAGSAPQENRCQEHCTLGNSLKDKFKSVSIGRLERFVADQGKRSTPAVAPPTGKKVAVIGSGPASITVAVLGGDIVLGAATVILAMGAGRTAAASINKELSQ